MTLVVFVRRDGSQLRVSARTGDTILSLAQRNQIDEIEGACEGCLACSTCHVVVDEAWISKLPPPSEEEEDMLDYAFGLTETSRLGCQIEISPHLDGMVVWLPAGSNNMLLA